MHLRKIAQHPLLVRSLYQDSTMREIAAIAHKRWVAQAAVLTIKQPVLDPCLTRGLCPYRSGCCTLHRRLDGNVSTFQSALQG